MVARGEKPRCQSPHFNVHVELDNRALKAKNNSLTQAVAKLQQDNAELLKQITLLQGESFEINSKYNNLKNVISIIDSTTKTCLPKLNEVVETFTGIIQLCAVANNISNSHRDTRTQAVKPQIVNGHVLHNPTITLSRLESNVSPNTSRISSNVTVRPSTSQGSTELNNEGNTHLNGSQESDSDSDSVDNSNGNEEEDTSFVCQATRGVCNRKKSSTNMDTAQLPDEDSDDSDEEMPAAEEEEVDEEDQSDQRLTTIQEDEEDEEEEEMSSSLSPRAKQRRFLKGRLQEVRIYLNQLPNSYADQIRGSGNISISVSPPERRSSYKQRSSSLVGEANESPKDNRHSFLDENISNLSRSLNVVLENSNLSPNRTMNNSRSKLSMTFHATPEPLKSSKSFESDSDASNNGTLQFSQNISAINNLPTTSNAGASPDSSIDSKSRNSKEVSLMSLDLHYKTSTPIVLRKSNESPLNRTGPNNSFNKSANKNEDSLTLKSNVTKRRATSREKRKVAQVLLNRLSLEKRLSRSPIKIIKDIVNTPPITKPSEIKSRLRNSGDAKTNRAKSPNEENSVSKKTGTKGKRKKDSPTKKIDIKKDTFAKTKFSPQKSPVGRPKRAARPKTLKEPNLTKKMRRSR